MLQSYSLISCKGCISFHEALFFSSPSLPRMREAGGGEGRGRKLGRSGGGYGFLNYLHHAPPANSIPTLPPHIPSSTLPLALTPSFSSLSNSVFPLSLSSPSLTYSIFLISLSISVFPLFLSSPYLTYSIFLLTLTQFSLSLSFFSFSHFYSIFLPFSILVLFSLSLFLFILYHIFLSLSLSQFSLSFLFLSSFSSRSYSSPSLSPSQFLLISG